MDTGKSWDRNACSQSAVALSFKARGGVKEMKLIPWQEIWRTLFVARIRGNPEMIAVFLRSLFEEAAFDDRGAWSGREKILVAETAMNSVKGVKK